MKWFNTERGAGMAEYALLVLLIAIVALVGVKISGQSVSGTFDTVTESLAEG